MQNFLKFLFGSWLHVLVCKNGKYFRSIIGDSVSTFNEFIELRKNIPTKVNSSKTFSTNLNEKKGNL